RHIVRPVASGLCRDHKTTSRTAAPRPTRAQATVGGLIPSTETLMKRNDQPQMKASRKRRRIGVRRSQANAERGHAYNARMSRSMLERRLTEVSDRLKQLREELVLTDEQVAHFNDAADEARIRALVSETPLADREHHEAQRHADAYERHRSEVQT